jgi:Zn-dependent peptidase ImmA (M78 family)
MLVDDFPVPILSDAEVQRLAFDWREKLNQHFLSNCLDIPALITAVGDALGSPITVELRPDDAMGRANAFVSADRSTVYVRASLVDAAAAGDPEAVFDGTHELGHLIMHRAQIPLARMASRDNRHAFLQPEESAEHQANLFSRSFLMTDEEVAYYRSAEALSENCFVPLHQAELRLREYDRTTGRQIRADKRSEALMEARLKGYEPMPCRECLNLTLVRSGSCLTCVTCGGTSGCS